VMSIGSGRLEAYDRLAPCFASPMLMLGRQRCHVKEYADAADFFKRRYGVEEYAELDLYSEGDVRYRLDLNDDLSELSARFGSVVNLGTLEHVWDVHAAWSNALRFVRLGGYFVSCAPVAGFDGHGIHVTGSRWIAEFVGMNGFEILDLWEDSDAHGRFKVPKNRTVMWLAARKTLHLQREIHNWRIRGSIYTDMLAKPAQGRKAGARAWW